MKVLTNVDCDEVVSSIPDDGQGLDEPTIPIVRDEEHLDDDATQRMPLVPCGLLESG